MSERQEFMREILDMRGVEEPCQDCGGLGVKTYGDTTTWRGGTGGQSFTSDVCNKCWGSGDRYRHWLNLRTVRSAP